MPASKIVYVRQAVVAAVADLAAFADFAEGAVMYSFQDKGLRELAYTRDAIFEHQPASMKTGRTFRKEEAGFEFVIWVERPVSTPEEADERAMELGLAVEEWVADNRNLAGVDWLLVQGTGSLKEAAGDQSSFSELILPIRYHARLT